MTKMKRFLSIVVTVCMLVSILATGAFAVSISTKSGDVRLALPADASFSFAWSGKGSVTSDLPCTHEGSTYRISTGAYTYSITSKSGDLSVVEKK